MGKLPKELSISEELDFHYLLQLLPALSNNPEFAWLSELFSIIGVDAFITLCRYCGGETITIPTVSQLMLSIKSLQYYYDVYVKKSKSELEIPTEYVELVNKIVNTYN